MFVTDLVLSCYSRIKPLFTCLMLPEHNIEKPSQGSSVSELGVPVAHVIFQHDCNNNI